MAAELNRLTKICNHLQADYNDNDRAGDEGCAVVLGEACISGLPGRCTQGTWQYGALDVSCATGEESARQALDDYDCDGEEDKKYKRMNLGMGCGGTWGDCNPGANSWADEVDTLPLCGEIATYYFGGETGCTYTCAQKWGPLMQVCR